MKKKNKRKRIKIRPWPFDADEMVKVEHIGNPYMKEDRSWFFDVLFTSLEGDKKEVLSLPWKLIRYVVTGRAFLNGIQLDLMDKIDDRFKAKLNLNRIHIKIDTTSNDIEMSSFTNYIIHEDRMPEMFFSPVFHIRNTYKTIQIPVIELMKAVIIKNDFLADQVIKQEPLDQYMTMEVGEYNSLILRFSKAYPSALLTQVDITYLLMLTYCKQFQKEWKEIYKSIISSDHFLIKELPFEGEVSLYVRCGEQKEMIEVEEILRMKHSPKIQTRHEKIIYYSPHIKKPGEVEIDEDKETQSRKHENDDEQTIDTEEGYALNQTIKSEIESTVTIINTNFKMERGYEDDDPENQVLPPQNPESSEEELSSGDCNIPHSAGESGQSGKLKSIEFKGLDQYRGIHGELDIFLEILKELEKLNYIKSIEICCEEMPLQLMSNTFLKLSDGKSPRHYIAAKINCLNKTVYLMEFQRDGWPISTLLYKQVFDSADMGEITNELLELIRRMNGVWKTQGMAEIVDKGVTWKRVKHTYKEYDLEYHVKRLFGYIEKF